MKLNSFIKMEADGETSLEYLPIFSWYFVVTLWFSSYVYIKKIVS